MLDDEGDVHVCDICQEIFLGTDELDQHMKEDHADKEVRLLKQPILKHCCQWGLCLGSFRVTIVVPFPSFMLMNI